MELVKFFAFIAVFFILITVGLFLMIAFIYLLFAIMINTVVPSIDSLTDKILRKLAKDNKTD